MSVFPKRDLSTVCDISMGQAPKGDSYNTTKSGYPLIAGAGDFGERTPAPKKYTDAPTKLSRPGDLILCIRATIGDRNWSDKEYCLGRGVAGLRANDADLSQAYLGHWLDHIAPVLRARGRGATFLQISKTDIASLQIPLPLLAEQKRIAGILDAVDALQVKRRRALADLDTLLQSIFFDMFGDPVTNPQGWEVKPLNELLGEKLINGAYYPEDAYSSVGIRMVHMANAFYGVVNLNEVKRVDAPLADIEKYDLLPTDILVSRRSLNYEGSAKPCRIPETDEPLIFESSLIRVRPDREKILTTYLFHYLSNDRGRAKYVFPLVTRSTISGISQSNLLKVKVVVPSLDRQYHFATLVKSLEQQRATQRDHLAELDILLASLQSRAFRGDL